MTTKKCPECDGKGYRYGICTCGSHFGGSCHCQPQKCEKCDGKGKYTITTRELSPFEQFHSYMRGWRCGAAHGVLDPRYTEHSDERFRRLYLDGYHEGNEAARKMERKMSKQFKYKPSILRIQGKEEP